MLKGADWKHAALLRIANKLAPKIQGLKNCGTRATLHSLPLNNL